MSQSVSQGILSLWFQLESAATFGRGEGIPGVIDRDVVIDELGCPYLHGRTLKGLLNEVCIDLLCALDQHASFDRWVEAADALFGRPGSTHSTHGIMYVGHAQLPEDLRLAIQAEIRQERWTREEITNSLTAIRRQSAMEVTGVPKAASLRSMRVILRQTTFVSQLHFRRVLTGSEQALLAACVKGLRRAGTARNRGRGRLVAWLEDEHGATVTEGWFQLFKQEVGV
ncbi:hypothetical protein GC175_18355 [bacterium]|nr:hypothetical protein [bacterium]